MFVTQLDETQRATFEQFKEAIKDCQLVNPDDNYILKWLVARSFDIDQAEKMLRQSIEWRRANRIDGILDQWEPPEVLKKYYPVELAGVDKFGCPICIVPFGQADWRGILQSVSKRDYLRYICYLAEMGMTEIVNNSKLAQKPIIGSMFIIDMEGLSGKQMSYKPFRDIGLETVKLLEANYPEDLRKTIIINAPKLFTLVFAMVKPFLNPVTLEKISVLGFDRKEWSAALLKEMDANQLPVRYGGTMKESDPKWNQNYSFVEKIGEEVPQSYYLAKVKPTPKDYMISLDVPKRKKIKFEHEITQVNSILRWEFMTEDCDIGFSVYYMEDDGKRVDLMNERMQSHLVMEEGQIVCTRTCTYVLEFDNSYSVLRSKTVWHHMVVDLPSSTPVSFEELNQ
ncbi:SEC14-like protein 2 isoform X2 [Daphnia pulex]|uniref:SEC14-like protein 2 isoform X2 n=1 Tax=Daphnia pulex TaxID=6669 RepID=UPI001EDE0DD2|nr:SEC14-like protein 2 isoform X2 [Daphnia pulex]